MNKVEISKALSKKLGKEVKIDEINLVGSGYHSDGYKVSTNQGDFFLKKIKSDDLGFEFPERKILSLLVSHGMSSRQKSIHPNSIGVAVKNKEFEFLPEINQETEVYHFQEFGGEGRSYLSMINDKEKKKDLDSIDKQEIDKVIDFICKIHKTKHPTKDQKKLTSVYNDSLRSVIGHPEYMLLLLQNMGDSPTLKTNEQQGKFIALMLEAMQHFKNHPERLVALHGDFWGANAFFKENGDLFMIDYSRMPWGDAGFDIGFWTSVYIMKYHITKNDYFRKIADYFLNKYIEKTKDRDIKKTMVYSLGLVAVMYSSETWVPGIDNNARTSFFNHVCEILKKKEFFWN